MKTALLTVHAPEWQDVLETSKHDFHHLPGYVRLSASAEGGEPIAFMAREGERALLIPLIIRPVHAPFFPENLDVTDAVSPYGYAGPICTPSVAANHESVEFLRSAATRLIDSLKELRVASAIIRCHPLLTSAHGPLAEFGEFVEHGETVWIDLARDDRELRKEVRPGHRTEIDKLRASGFEVDIDEGSDRLGEFGRIYRETMDRVGARPSYYFGDQYFAELKSALGDRLRIFWAKRGNETASAAMFTECDGIVQYHLSGTADAYVRLHSSKLLIDAATKWAKARGNGVLHLGGGVGGREDSLFRFKAGFSKRRATFRTWRLVVDRAVYDDLCRSWEHAAGRTLSSADHFFPAYRQPITPPAAS